MSIEMERQRNSAEHRNADRCKSKILAREQIRSEIHALKEQLDNLKRSGTEYAKLKLRLSYLETLPWFRESFKAVDVVKAKQILDMEHHGLEDVKQEVLDYICSSNQAKSYDNEVILLSGPPGTGKTSIAKQIAAAMDRAFYKISLGGLSDDIYLKGSAVNYANSKPGALIEILYRARSRRIVILLDEIDKLSKRSENSDASAALLDALDFNNQFLDRFVNIPFDCSDVVFIATANYVENIPAPLRDRMTEIRISPYGTLEKIEILKRHIIPKEIEKSGFELGRVKVHDSVIRNIVKEDINNAGIRNLTRSARKLSRLAVRMDQQTEKRNIYITSKVAIQHNIIVESDANKTDFAVSAPGQSLTPIYNAYTGEIGLCNIEAAFIAKTDEIKVIGSENKALKHLVEASYTALMKNQNSLGVKNTSFEKVYPVVDLSAAAGFHTDASLGLAVFCAMYGALTDIVFPLKHAFLGRVMIGGAVRSTENIMEYARACLNQDVELLIVPKSLKEEIDQEYGCTNCIIVYVDHVSEMTKLMRKFEFYTKIGQNVAPERGSYNLDDYIDEGVSIRQYAMREKVDLMTALNAYFNTPDKESKADLDTLVGLSSVKETIDRFVKYNLIAKKRKSAQLAVKDVSMHMVFKGNPGTGKTSVAKILGKMLFELNLVKSRSFIEVTRDDLVGKYIGHTEERVKEIINKGKGGIIYIDEAHALFNGSGNDFGRIVISSLVKAMEDNRNEFVLIMSGYPDEMDQMIHSNVGLRDRIAVHLNFEDYSDRELFQIFEAMCKDEDYIFSKGCRHVLMEYFKGMTMRRSKFFSNGRFVRNLFENTKIMHAIRVSNYEKIEDHSLSELHMADIELAIDMMKSESRNNMTERNIGFLDPDMAV